VPSGGLIDELEPLLLQGGGDLQNLFRRILPDEFAITTENTNYGAACRVVDPEI